MVEELSIRINSKVIILRATRIVDLDLLVVDLRGELRRCSVHFDHPVGFRISVHVEAFG